MGWCTFWNGQTTIYVNELHRQVHYRHIAADIAALLPASDLRVLDYGCGEAIHANIVAARCRRLVLCDAASTVRDGLASRFRKSINISVAAPEDVAALGDGTFDVIIVNSVLQYVTPSHLGPLVAQWRRLLSAEGTLVLGDLIPRDVGALTDAAALMQFARANGFLIPAIAGLFKTFFSDYRRKRAELGLLRFDEEEVLDLLKGCGFVARRQSRNIGHNPARMTIVATTNDRLATLAPAVASSPIRGDAQSRRRSGDARPAAARSRPFNPRSASSA